jgi:hypothetical protein
VFGIISQRGFESRPVRQNTLKALQIIDLQGLFIFPIYFPTRPGGTIPIDRKEQAGAQKRGEA